MLFFDASGYLVFFDADIAPTGGNSDSQEEFFMRRRYRTDFEGPCYRFIRDLGAEKLALNFRHIQSCKISGCSGSLTSN